MVFFLEGIWSPKYRYYYWEDGESDHKTFEGVKATFSAVLFWMPRGQFTMFEKLCLQWNDFKDDVTSALGSLREDNDFADVTLACEDGQQVEAHKVILAASSSFSRSCF